MPVVQVASRKFLKVKPEHQGLFTGTGDRYVENCCNVNPAITKSLYFVQVIGR